MELSDHLFRRESGRMVAALTRVFGIHNLALAEDVVQDAFCRAMEVWPFRGLPENPSAWLMATAKNRAIDVLRRERTARTFAPELGRLLESEWTLVPIVDEILAGSGLNDDLLRMMFSCCHPRLREDAQVALVLHILCGFSSHEIAAAFFSTEAATYKRIERAKKVLAGSKHLFDLKAADFAARLSAVQRALYLLFNEGYHGASAESAVRAELCQEALRLVTLLVGHPLTATSSSYALAALLHLHGKNGIKSGILVNSCHGGGELRFAVSAMDSMEGVVRWKGDHHGRGAALLEHSLDPPRVRRLAAIGVSPGWRCLDVGWPLVVSGSES